MIVVRCPDCQGEALWSMVRKTSFVARAVLEASVSMCPRRHPKFFLRVCGTSTLAHMPDMRTLDQTEIDEEVASLHAVINIALESLSVNSFKGEAVVGHSVRGHQRPTWFAVSVVAAMLSSLVNII